MFSIDKVITKITLVIILEIVPKWDTRYFQKIYQTYISKWKGLQVAIPLSNVTLCNGMGADRARVIIVHLNCPMTKKMILLTL